MGVLYLVRARSGDSYTDRGGQEKESYVTIGRMVETAKGAKMIILDAIPFTWFGDGKPAVLYLQAPKEKEGGSTAPTTPKPAPGDDDLPF